MNESSSVNRTAKSAAVVAVFSGFLAACSGADSQAPDRWTLQPMPLGLGFGLRLDTLDGPAGGEWCLFRGWPDESIHVIADCTGPRPRSITYPRMASGELLVLGSFAVGDDIVLSLYDAARNVPPGRTSGPTLDGIDFVRFSADGTVRTLAELVPLPAFDYPVYGGETDFGTVACAHRRCFRLGAAGASEIITAELTGHEIVEALVRPWGVDALIRTDLDGESGAPPAGSTYRWARIDDGGARVMGSVPTDCVPYQFASSPATATWACAGTAAEFADLLKREVERMPHGGSMDIGVTNLEGRVAWSQVYYLNGLMQITGGGVPSLQAAADWEDLHRRLTAEIGLLAARADRDLFAMHARRYSVNRDRLLFALHLGRLATVFENAIRAGHLDAGSIAVERVASTLSGLDGTVERLTEVVHAAGEFSALEFTRGADFWCDGANVPFNYTSAVVHGSLALHGVSASDRAVALLEPLRVLEPVAVAETWRYWWGLGRDGWTAADDVSTNTPSYVGQDGLAHITYRTMDAQALLMLEVVSPGSLHPAEIENIRRLVAQGSLLPSVNEIAARSVGGPIALSRDAAYQFARSAAPFELQSQVWALEQLIGGNL